MSETDQIKKTPDVAVAPHVKNPKRVAAATRLAASRARAKQEKQQDAEQEKGSSFAGPSLSTALSIVGIVIGVVNVFMWCKRPHVVTTPERPSAPADRPVRRGME